ncbi:MAG: hypothetical protein IKD40_01200 [Bacteroidaceae bacterium]|nr:hypothetical protein [Bacteroidaceae bacterium]
MASNDSGKKVVGDVDERIVERLKERGRKLSQMKIWDKKKSGNFFYRYLALAVAASVAMFMMVDLWRSNGNVIERLGIDVPAVESYRSAVPELANINMFLNDGKFYDAIDAAEDILEHSDWIIEQMEMFLIEGDEEMEYQYHAEKMMNSEIRWAYIYALVMIEAEKTALKELKKYLQDEQFCAHREEAEAMLDALD